MRDPRKAALWLVGATLGYNVVEAVVALWSGVSADSIALVGFGLDSVIECAAAGVLLWRFSLEFRGAAGEEVERAEHRVHRFIGGTFIVLALYVSADAGYALWRREAPAASVPGIVLASVSVVVMPVVAWRKLKVAAELGSASLRSEAKETLACSWLSLALLLGLGANAAWGIWWADPLAAIAMVPWLVKEGIEGLRGEEGCGCS